jgi:hypothetical protein
MRIIGMGYMQSSIVDSSEEPLLPEDVRIRSLSTSMYGDGRRVKISLELTPFQTPPNIMVLIRDQDGEELASTNIIGSMRSQMEFTMHLPDIGASSSCVLYAAADYPEQGRVHEVETSFSLSNNSVLGEV